MPSKTIVFHLLPPSKKNKLRPRRWGAKGKGFHYDRTTSLDLDAMVLEAITQWGPLPAVLNPDIEIQFRTKSTNWDKDGAYTAIQDSLVQAGVLGGDSVKKCNGKITILEAIIDKDQDESATVLLSWWTQNEVKNHEKEKAGKTKERRTPRTGLRRFP